VQFYYTPIYMRFRKSFSADILLFSILILLATFKIVAVDFHKIIVNSDYCLWDFFLSFYPSVCTEFGNHSTDSGKILYWKLHAKICRTKSFLLYEANITSIFRANLLTSNIFFNGCSVHYKVRTETDNRAKNLHITAKRGQLYMF
jgi:hypothetical protein